MDVLSDPIQLPFLSFAGIKNPQRIYYTLRIFFIQYALLISSKFTQLQIYQVPSRDHRILHHKLSVQSHGQIQDS